MIRRGLVEDEGVRSARLLDAQAKAADLFAAIEPRGIIAPGVREIEASDAVRDLAAEMFGVDRHWHKRIVRAGPNTLQPYRKNPPDRTIGVSPALQAHYLTEAFAIARRNPRIDMMLWFLLRDEPNVPAGWQSGFFDVRGRKKPSFNAFRRLPH